MGLREYSKLFWALLYLGGLFLVGGWFYSYISAFEGLLLVEAGRAESVMVREADGGGFLGIQRNMPADFILFDNPRAAQRLDPKKGYNARKLPFALRVEQVDVRRRFAPREVLQIGRGDEARTIEVAPGDMVNLGDAAYEVATLRPFSGLVRHPTGEPTVVFSVRRPGEPWTERLFAGPNAWTVLEPDLGARLHWFEDRAAALVQEVTADAVLQGRWGVREGRRMHWFSSFTPGTGATLAGPTEVTLLAHDLAYPTADGPRPAVHVRLQYGDVKNDVWAVANAGQPEARILYESPRALETVLLFQGWREGAVRVVALQEGRPAGALQLAETERWRPAGVPYEVRVDQAMGAALRLTGAEAVRELVLRQDGAVAATLREGQGQQFAGTYVRYRRMPVPPTAAYEVSVLRDGAAVRTLEVVPGGAFREGFWRFSLGPPNPDAAHSALFRVERTAGGPVQWLGLAMFVGGSFALVLLRFWPAPAATPLPQVDVPETSLTSEALPEDAAPDTDTDTDADADALDETPPRADERGD